MSALSCKNVGFYLFSSASFAFWQWYLTWDAGKRSNKRGSNKLMPLLEINRHFKEKIRELVHELNGSGHWELYKSLFLPYHFQSVEHCSMFWFSGCFMAWTLQCTWAFLWLGNHCVHSFHLVVKRNNYSKRRW